MPRFFLTLSALVLAGCAASPPPPLTAAHPASPDAPEGARLSRSASLRADETTRKTAALLSAAKKEQEHWDAHGPVSGTAAEETATSAKPTSEHEHN